MTETVKKPHHTIPTSGSDVVIQVMKLGKQYRLGTINHGTLRADVASWWAQVRGKQDPNVKVDAVMQNGGKGPASPDRFWALNDVSFEVKKGEVVGIIGRNGAGKSTLLKILSKVTTPTTGLINVDGRIASLLEVGTGFHPELTGRENIFLNGAILGMNKQEVKGKFDEIVEFAEVKKFIDTPVKRYSSGMYVRLAFAVAAHLDTEILLVDEVLAVGDVSFQQKCIGKMNDVARGGKTVLFVSHNMGVMTRLCSSGILLEKGEITKIGSIHDVVSAYTEGASNSPAIVEFKKEENKKMQALRISLLDEKGNQTTTLSRELGFEVVVDYEVREKINGAHIGFMLDKLDGSPICHSADTDLNGDQDVPREKGSYTTKINFPGGILNAGVYQIRIGMGRYGGEVFDHQVAFIINISDLGTFASTGQGGRQRPGVLALPLSWQTNAS